MMRASWRVSHRPSSHDAGTDSAVQAGSAAQGGSMSRGHLAIRYGLLALMLFVDAGLVAFGIVYLVPHAHVFG